MMAAAVLMAGCGIAGAPEVVGGGVETATVPVPTESAAGDGLLPRCSDIPEIDVADELFGDSPVYVGNEQPTEAVMAWGSTHDGYEELWIDRDHNGWIVVAFSQDVDTRRAEAAELFPNDGVVVIEVDWSVAALRALQDTVPDRLGDIGSASFSVDIMNGFLELDLGVIDDGTEERLADEFSGERVCLNVPDPATIVAPGEQPTSGEGWRLLAADRDAGVPFMTGIATDTSQLANVWQQLSLAGEPPAVDFEAEIVVWFGIGYGGSCPERRLDDVVVVTANDSDLAVVFPVVVDPTNPVACTADLAGGWGFVTAVQRDRLPSGPFIVQLQAEGAATGGDAERTRVNADLSVPGATATDAQIAGIGRDPSDSIVRDGAIIEPGFPTEYAIYVHCGVAQLGTLNDIVWVSTGRESPSAVQTTPPAWAPFEDERQEITVEVLLEEGDPPTITATLEGTSVTYVPGDPSDDGCD